MFRSFIMLCFLAIHQLGCASIYVDDQPIEKTLKIGQTLIYDLPDEEDGFKLSYKDGNFKVFLLILEKDFVKEYYLSFLDQKSQMRGLSAGKTLQLTSGKSLTFEGQSLKGNEIILAAKDTIKISDCFLESPSIAFISNNFEFSGCFFLEPKTVRIIAPNSEEALIRSIEITFKNNSSLPFLLNGNLNTISFEEDFDIIGASQIVIEFGEKAFNP